eukprot:TRINITY_DN11639_c0_g1_i1.p1 TRINITY_DN11639_c0_g1~~TRINITY_DN11639_c0_g1_i1.p1  ORF type:complete len:113 (-),score=32.92 TRINITY_DN11639_c0_g1_i1:96-434(-)
MLRSLVGSEMCIRDSIFTAILYFWLLSSNWRASLILVAMYGLPLTSECWVTINSLYLCLMSLTDGSDDPMTPVFPENPNTCLLYTSDAADEEDSVDLGGRRIIKKKKHGKKI